MNVLSEEFGLVSHGLGQCVEYRDVLLDAGRYIRTYSREGSAPLPAAEAARYLLPDFGHPHVLLGLVVGKGDSRMIQECQYPILMRVETLEQIHRFGLGDASSLALFAWRRLKGIALVALLEQAPVAAPPLLWRVDARLGACLKQKLLERLRLRLAEVLEEGQLSDDMSVADSMFAI